MKLNSYDELVPHQPVRNIGPTRRSVSGVFPFRGERSIPFESTLERDFLIRKEFSPLVLDIIPQPIKIPFRANSGREYTYTPDFLVHYRASNHPFGEGLRPLLVEVKPREIVRRDWPEMKAKFRAAWRYASEQGWDFRIQDESRIRDQVLANILFLRRYKHMQFPAEEAQVILATLEVMGQAPFHYLVGRHFNGVVDTAIGISQVWSLLANGQIACDMTLPLHNNTVLWSSHHE